MAESRKGSPVAEYCWKKGLDKRNFLLMRGRGEELTIIPIVYLMGKLESLMKFRIALHYIARLQTTTWEGLKLWLSSSYLEQLNFLWDFPHREETNRSLANVPT